MTPDEARLSISDLYRATRDAIGGSWEIDTRTWLGCGTSENAEGATFHLGGARFDQELPGDAAEVARRIQELWNSRGIAAEIVDDRSIGLTTLSYPRLGNGSGPDGYLVVVGVREGSMTFDGHSHCVPGDSYELDLSEVGRRDE